MAVASSEEEERVQKLFDVAYYLAKEELPFAKFRKNDTELPWVIHTQPTKSAENLQMSSVKRSKTPCLKI